MQNKEYFALYDTDTWYFISTWYGSESLSELLQEYIKSIKEDLRWIATVEGYRVDEYIFNLSEKDILDIIASTSLVVTSLNEEELKENSPV